MAGEQLLAKAVLTGAMRLAQEEGLLLFYKGLFKGRVVGKQLTRNELFVRVTLGNVAIEVGPPQLQLPDAGSGQAQLPAGACMELPLPRLQAASLGPRPAASFQNFNVTLRYRRYEIGIYLG